MTWASENSKSSGTLIVTILREYRVSQLHAMQRSSNQSFTNLSNILISFQLPNYDRTMKNDEQVIESPPFLLLVNILFSQAYLSETPMCVRVCVRARIQSPAHKTTRNESRSVWKEENSRQTLPTSSSLSPTPQHDTFGGKGGRQEAQIPPP